MVRRHKNIFRRIFDKFRRALFSKGGALATAGALITFGVSLFFNIYDRWLAPNSLPPKFTITSSIEKAGMLGDYVILEASMTLKNESDKPIMLFEAWGELVKYDYTITPHDTTSSKVIKQDSIEYKSRIDSILYNRPEAFFHNSYYFTSSDGSYIDYCRAFRWLTVLPTQELHYQFISLVPKNTTSIQYLVKAIIAKDTSGLRQYVVKRYISSHGSTGFALIKPWALDDKPLHETLAKHPSWEKDMVVFPSQNKSFFESRGMYLIAEGKDIILSSKDSQ